MAADVYVCSISSRGDVALISLFQRNDVSAVTRQFQPFPLTADAAKDIASLNGSDRYFLLRVDGVPAGFCMLRGWTEGYETPSLVIFVYEEFLGQGLGKLLIRFAVAEAEQVIASAVSLSVYVDKEAARAICRDVGFVEDKRDRRKLDNERRTKIAMEKLPR